MREGRGKIEIKKKDTEESFLVFAGARLVKNTPLIITGIFYKD